MHHFLAFFNKVHKFVQSSVFSIISAPFVIFSLGAPLFSDFTTKCTSLYKSAFSAQDQHVLSFLHWEYHFLHISARRTSLYKAVFSPGIRMFCHFRTWLTTFKPFLAKCTSLCKRAFSELDQHVLSFSHWAHYFLATFNKVHEFVENSVFSPRSARFVIFILGIPLFTL